MKMEGKGIATILISIAMVCAIPLIGMDKILLTIPGWAYAIVTVLMLTLAAGCIVNVIYEKLTGKDCSQRIRLIVSALVTVGSLIVGLISYHNDHSFMMRGMEAELIWVLISAPTFIMSIVLLIGYFKTNYTLQRKKEL